MNSNSTKPRVAFISHGGGPLPLLGDPNHGELVDNLHEVANLVGQPKSIVVISAHWEEGQATVTSGSQPDLIYDYYGFPEESYQIQYPAPGAPELADTIATLLQNKNLAVQQDPTRGFDHGLFVPLKIMYPDANIPSVQLSLLNNLDPLQHIQLGHALSQLVDDDVLILGSGFSFHNLPAFFAPSTEQDKQQNRDFDLWLTETCTNPQLSENQREQLLVDWTQAPAARYCHPREEHLLPLHVCYGSAGGPARQAFSFTVLGKLATALLW